MRLTVSVALLALLVSSAAAQKAVGRSSAAQPAPGDGYRERHALCIGINDYASPDVPDLTYAEADAREMAEVLRGDYGFRVQTLLGKAASRQGITAAIANLFDPGRVHPDDAVLIYFSGHGQTVKQNRGEVGYLVPQDAPIKLSDVSNPALYRRYALRMNDLQSDADGIPARHVLFIVDACYSGFAASKTIKSSPALSNALRYSARQVITAGTAGEKALEHPAWGHGALTHKVLEILRAETQPLPATKLGVWLKERVPRAVAARFGDRFTLTPQAKYLSGDGDFVFIRVASKPKPAPLRLKCEVDRTKIYVGRPFDYVCTLENAGDAPLRGLELLVDFDAGLQVHGNDSAKMARGKVDELPPGEQRSFKCSLAPTRIGDFAITAKVTAEGLSVTEEIQVEARGSRPTGHEPAAVGTTDVELVADWSVVEVGDESTLIITLTQLGTAHGTNLRLNVTLPPGAEYVSADGPTNASLTGEVLEFKPLPNLAPRARATYRVRARFRQAGELKWFVDFHSDQQPDVFRQEELVRVY